MERLRKIMLVLAVSVPPLCAQYQIGSRSFNTGSAPTYNWTVVDWSGLSNTTTPTTTTLGNSTFGGPTGWSWSLVGTTAQLQGSTSYHYDILSGAVNLLTGGSYTDSGSLSLMYLPGTATTDAAFAMPSTSSAADEFAVNSDIPQTITAFGRMDNDSLLNTAVSDFLTLQITNPAGTALQFNVESNGSTGELAITPAMATSTTYIISRQYNQNATHYIGFWNTSGTLLAYGTAAAAGNFAPGTNFMGDGSGANIGPTGGYHVWWGQKVLATAASASAFPLVPSPPGAISLQLPPVAVSPVGGYFGSGGTTVTLSTIVNGYSPSILYSTSGTPSCPGTGTTYSTPISVTTTETLSAVVCESGFTGSTAAVNTYTVTTSPIPDTALLSQLQSSCAITTGCTFNIGNVTVGDTITLGVGWQTSTVTIAVTDNCNTGGITNTYAVGAGPTTGGSGRGEQLSAQVGATTTNCTVKVIPSATTSMNLASVAWKQIASGCDKCSTVLSTSGTTTGSVTTTQTDSVFVWWYDAGGGNSPCSAGSGYVFGAKGPTWPICNQYAAAIAAGTFTATVGYSGSTTHLIKGIMTVH